MFQHFCEVWGDVQFLIPFGMYFLSLLLTLGLIIKFSIDAFTASPKQLKFFYQLTVIVVMLIACASTFIIVSITFFLLFVGDDAPPSKDFHNLNAAVKNTCFLDPLRQSCPHSVEELLKIEPEHFIAQTRDSVLTYQYYPETNTYTLIVRDKDIRKNNNRVVIFDPRLATNESYEKGARFGAGLDFVDASAYQCFGKIGLISVPPFPGPWQNIN